MFWNFPKDFGAINVAIDMATYVLRREGWQGLGARIHGWRS